MIVARRCNAVNLGLDGGEGRLADRPDGDAEFAASRASQAVRRSVPAICHSRPDCYGLKAQRGYNAGIFC